MCGCCHVSSSYLGLGHDTTNIQKKKSNPPKSQPNHKPKPITSSPPTIGKKKKKNHQNHKPVILSLPKLTITTGKTKPHPPKTIQTHQKPSQL